MEKGKFVQWMKEPLYIAADIFERRRTIFLDNRGWNSVNEETKEKLNNLKLSLRFIPPNSTDFCQPCKSFLIQKRKEHWDALWDVKKASLYQVKNGSKENILESYQTRGSHSSCI